MTDEQIQALERYNPEFRERHIEVHATGELVAVDTFYAGTLKGVGKVYIQTVLDCYSRHVWARLYTSKLPVTAVHVLNNEALPFFEEHGVKVRTILSDNGREFCGRPDRHPYELFLQLEDIEHALDSGSLIRVKALGYYCEPSPGCHTASELRTKRTRVRRDEWKMRSARPEEICEFRRYTCVEHAFPPFSKVPCLP